MVHTAANSLRSPLLALKIYLDLLKNFPQEERKTDVLNRMKVTTHEMAAKINALATLVDIQNEPLAETEQVCIQDIFEEVKLQLSKEIKDGDVVFSTNFEIPSIQANASEMSLLLFHLLQNAISFRKEGEPVQISIKTKKVGGYYLIGIKDNGIGMQLKNDDEADKLFQPFCRLDPQRQSVGIGLSIVKSIVSKYEGEIKVKSRIGEGTMFNIYLKS